MLITLFINQNIQYLEKTKCRNTLKVPGLFSIYFILRTILIIPIL